MRGVGAGAEPLEYSWEGRPEWAEAVGSAGPAGPPKMVQLISYAEVEEDTNKDTAILQR